LKFLGQIVMAIFHTFLVLLLLLTNSIKAMKGPGIIELNIIN